MSKVSIRDMKHQIRLNQWRAIINECQQSGIFVEKWCEEHGIGVKSYYYWLKKVREASLTCLPKALPTENIEEVIADVAAEHIEPVAIKPLVVEDFAFPSGNLVIHLPYGKVEVNGYMPKEAIQAAISALREATC